MIGMTLLDLPLLRRFRRRDTHPARFAETDRLLREDAARTMALSPVPSYSPEIREAAAAIVARAEAEAQAARESAETEPWGEWDQPRTPAYEPAPPPPMPFSGVSRIMVGQITPPDPADLSYDKDRLYREYFRRIGVATGTSTSLEDTGMWALPALERGDGTGERL